MDGKLITCCLVTVWCPISLCVPTFDSFVGLKYSVPFGKRSRIARVQCYKPSKNGSGHVGGLQVFPFFCFWLLLF